ncbi:bifunctional 23S rRNA (guanine(2069)-N(7))-methyltransferase RlmK/23S rRNA (guanine(2445)-N(2))-methyltransferase RlmL, partial [Kaarinaea lacus]
MSSLQYFATAARHLETLLAEELRGLGISTVKETRGGVHFGASLADAYRACLWSRIANRVLLPLAQFETTTPEQLYDGVYNIDWLAHFSVSNTFAIDVTTSLSALDHSHYAALKAKDAIADQFRQHRGERPSVQTDRPDILINIYVHKDQAIVSLDLSGESLHRRGYRQHGGRAPLKENLAAAILLRANWPNIAAQGGAFIDPMCGSGTLPIEAAMIAADIAPGLRRTHWGFLAWRQHKDKAWQLLLEDAHQRRSQGLQQLPPIRGFDEDTKTVHNALVNVENAGLHGYVHIEKRELGLSAPASADNPGLVAVNPPYGERLGEQRHLAALYERLGNTLKTQFLNWHVAVFTGNADVAKHMGLRIARTHTLYNGPIECKLLHVTVTAAAFAIPHRFPRPLTASERSEQAQMFANRLQKNQKQLAKWRRQEDIQCYRLYDTDMPEYALAVDVYEGEQRWVHVQEYEAPKSVDATKARLRLREALGVIIDELAISEEQLFFKVRRRQAGKAQYEKLAQQQRFYQVTENDCKFLVNFEDYLDTGLFLDHRLTRQLIQQLAANKHFLNLFAYTGTASVYAAKGGALSTTSVDMSNTYLDWSKRNLALNGFTQSQHQCIQADCL